MKLNLFISFFITMLALLYSCENNEPGNDNSEEDLCENVLCQNGGTCNDGDCDCPQGFSGTNCETVVNNDPCRNVTCQNGGNCNNGNCDCASNFWGDRCQYPEHPDSLQLYALDFDYWFTNNIENYGNWVTVNYYIGSTLIAQIETDIDMDNGDTRHDFIDPLTIPFPDDKILTIELDLNSQPPIGEFVYNPIFGERIPFVLFNASNELYSLQIFNSDGDAFLSNGEFSFTAYCKLIYAN